MINAMMMYVVLMMVVFLLSRMTIQHKYISRWLPPETPLARKIITDHTTRFFEAMLFSTLVITIPKLFSLIAFIWK